MSSFLEVQQVLRTAVARRRISRRWPTHPSQAGFWPLFARMRASRPPKRSDGEFVAIILVHRRPWNLDLQVRAALHAETVGEVVVSCNRPDLRLDEWLSVSSPRLRVLEEEGRNQTRRYAIALESDGDRFVLPDDDVLFLPSSLDAFCAALPADGTVPIGMAGQRCTPDGVWESAITGTGEEVDVLNRAYACTRAHAEAVFENASLLGWDEAATFSKPADDVLLSFAGQRCPMIVDLDHVNCVSHAHGSISTYRQDDFNPSRAVWVATLREKLGRAPASRDHGHRGALRATPTGAARAVNIAARPLRRRFYTGAGSEGAPSLLPRKLRRAAGLDDYRQLRTNRVQIGSEPVALQGFLRIDDDPRAPDVTVCGDLWSPRVFMGVRASEIVSFGVLDRISPHLVPVALATWRAALEPGGRLIVGARDASALLGTRDAKLGMRSWGSQLDPPNAAVTSPLQLVDAGLTRTLWDAERLRDALEAQGFEVVADASEVPEMERCTEVAPWWLGDDSRILEPVPRVLDGAADLILVARAR